MADFRWLQRCFDEMARFKNTPEGRREWIDHMMELAVENNPEGYPRTKMELKFLIEWIREDCFLRWGATVEEVKKEVERILNQLSQSE